MLAYAAILFYMWTFSCCKGGLLYFPAVSGCLELQQVLCVLVTSAFHVGSIIVKTDFSCLYSPPHTPFDNLFN